MTRLLRSVFFMKAIHIIVGLMLVGCTAYTFISTLIDQITVLTWFAYGLMLGEGFILILSGWKCPLTTYTENLGAEVGSVTHLFLPEFLAKRLFAFFKVFIVLCTGLLLFRVLS